MGKGIRYHTADGAQMYPCPLCGGQVYAKALWVGTAGNMHGVLSAMCADCHAHASHTLPEHITTTRVQFGTGKGAAPAPFELDEQYYREILAELETP